MSRAIVGYIQVSTAGQCKSGLKLEAQRVSLVKFAVAEGFRIVAEFVEVEPPRFARGSNLGMMRADMLSQVNAQSFIPAKETKGQSNENDNPAHTGGMSVSAITIET